MSMGCSSSHERTAAPAIGLHWHPVILKSPRWQSSPQRPERRFRPANSRCLAAGILSRMRLMPEMPLRAYRRTERLPKKRPCAARSTGCSLASSRKVRQRPRSRSRVSVRTKGPVAGGQTLKFMTVMPPSLLSLKGRRALVTGASSGIGEAIAHRLAAAGATVIIVYRSHSAAAKKTVANIEATGGEAMAFRADMAKERDIKSLFAQVLKKVGPLDILVNSAGMESKCPILTMPVKDWDQVMSVNLRAVFLCSQLGAQSMVKKNRGVIINISSVHAVLPWAGYALYCASKGGLEMLMKTMALE